MKNEKNMNGPEEQEKEEEKKRTRKKKQHEHDLDEDLEQTFPASDPPSHSVPGSEEEED